MNGKAFLAGPYKGAPLSIVAMTPAISGPYDLGDAVVRAAVNIDPITAQISAVTDPLPQILEGIPLRLRSILVKLDRPNFTLNPTNCSPFAVKGGASGTEGGSAGFSEHFQVANCANLPFAPKLELKVRSGTKRTRFPALSAHLTVPAGSANIAATSVALPHSLFIENNHLRNPCTKPQFASHTCPPGSVIGTAKAETPLLGAPLEGPVYLASGYGHKLPDIVADLNGQIHIVLDGRIDSDKQGGLRTTFETVPDAPVSSFTLNLQGGKKGLLVNSENLCKSTQKAIEKMTGQNGMQLTVNSKIATPCGGGKKAKKTGRAGK